MRWIILVAIIVFVVSQIIHLRPSKRDQQLQALRKAATRAGFVVRFWTLRNSGYDHRQLPESGFMYLLPRQSRHVANSNAWALWISANGEMLNIGGHPPDLARQCLTAFRERFPDAWALLECSDAGLGLLWQERGEPDDVQNIADALDLLRKNLDALPNK
ncbi:MAG TPA: hypothetical protein VLB90_11030 [Pseudomonadales bacterium]|nr:hypothetical protein [Pseudomonadales bacterium]